MMCRSINFTFFKILFDLKTFLRFMSSAKFYQTGYFDTFTIPGSYGYSWWIDGTLKLLRTDLIIQIVFVVKHNICVVIFLMFATSMLSFDPQAFKVTNSHYYMVIWSQVPALTIHKVRSRYLKCYDFVKFYVKMFSETMI